MACGGQSVSLASGDIGDQNQVEKAAASARVNLTSLSNEVLAAPRVHLVAFASDNDADELQRFVAALAKGTTWGTQTSEYGVGPLEAAPLVRSAFAWSSNVTSGRAAANPNSDVEAYLAAALAGSVPAWSGFDGNDIVVLLMPKDVAVVADAQPGPACANGLMAWHSAVVVPNKQAIVPYVVVAACGPMPTLGATESRTVVLGQALVATATNPRQAGFDRVDPQHLAWQVAAEHTEAAGMCVAAMHNSQALVARPKDLPYATARTWSNKAYIAGNAPCVPTDPTSDLYLAAYPQAVDAVALSLAQTGTVQSLGLDVSPGQQVATDLVLYTNQPSLGAWDVSVAEVGSSDLVLTLSKGSGRYGQVITLSVALVAAPKAPQQLVRLTSSRGVATFSEYLMVGQSP